MEKMVFESYGLCKQGFALVPVDKSCWFIAIRSQSFEDKNEKAKNRMPKDMQDPLGIAVMSNPLNKHKIELQYYEDYSYSDCLLTNTHPNNFSISECKIH